MMSACVCSYQYTHNMIFVGECAVTLTKFYIMSLNAVRNDDVALKSTGLSILEKGKALNDAKR